MPKIKSRSTGVNDLLFSELASKELAKSSSSIANIIEFAQAPWGLGLTLTPVQAFMLRCIFGLPLDDTDKERIAIPDVFNSKILHRFSEKEFAQWSYDEKRCNINFADEKMIADRDLYEIVLVLGRRSGKSLLAAIIIDYMFYRLLKMEDPQTYYKIPPGQEICVVGTAPTDGQAEVVFNDTKVFALNCPVLNDRITHPTQTYFEVQTDGDIKLYGKGKNGSVQFITGGSSAKSIRGHGNIAVTVDEMAFFIENGGPFSIDELYSALKPSIARFNNKETGKMDARFICLSSPYAHFGKFFNLYRESFVPEIAENGNIVCFKYYTSLVNADSAPENFLRNEYRQDRGKFMREYGAEFDERITSWIDDIATFQQNIRRPYVISRRGERYARYFWSFDLGTKDNGCALAILHRDDETGRYIEDFAEVWFGRFSSVWAGTSCTLYKDHVECARWKECDQIPLFELCRFIKRELLNVFPPFEIAIDQYSGNAFYQILINQGFCGVELVSLNQRSKSGVYQLCKNLYREGLLDLRDHPVLIPELLNLEAEKMPGDLISVSKRKSSDDAFQDDIADAFVRGTWRCWLFHNHSSAESGVPSIISFGSGTIVRGHSNVAGYGRALPSQARSITQYKILQQRMHGTQTRRTIS